MAGLGEEREESTKHTNEHVIKKMGSHSLQRLHEEGSLFEVLLSGSPPSMEENRLNISSHAEYQLQESLVNAD